MPPFQPPIFHPCPFLTEPCSGGHPIQPLFDESLCYLATPESFCCSGPVVKAVAFPTFACHKVEAEIASSSPTLEIGEALFIATPASDGHTCFTETTKQHSGSLYRETAPISRVCVQDPGMQCLCVTYNTTVSEWAGYVLFNIATVAQWIRHRPPSRCTSILSEVLKS